MQRVGVLKSNMEQAKHAMGRKNSSLIYLLALIISLHCMACSNTRHLTDTESLYLGSEVKVVDTALPKAEKKRLEQALTAAVRPNPNSTLFGIRFKLTLYNLAGKPKSEKGIRNWLRNKIGEPPVLGSDLNIESNKNLMDNLLDNQGYFNAELSGRKEIKNKRAKGFFEVTAGPRSTIRSIIMDDKDTSSLKKDIAALSEGSLLKPGEPYSLETIKNERIRIDDALKNEGYYYFSPEYLIIDADTGIGNHLIDMTLKLKHAEMPANAEERYKINSLTILPNYRLVSNSRDRSSKKDSISNAEAIRRGPTSADTVHFDNFTVVDRQKLYRPQVFYQAMQLDPGKYYSRKDQNVALNRLVTLGAFKFVKNEFTPLEESGEHLLDVTYLLTPYPRKAFNIDFGGYTLNDSRGGVRGTLSWRNKNIFGGAELLTLKLSGGFEAQYGGMSQMPNAYNLGLEANLNVPRFMVPFVSIKPSGLFIPRTIMSVAYNYSLKTGFYQINSLNFGFGYNWKENAAKDHKFFPFNLTLVKTDTINQEKKDSLNLSALVYNGIILGPTYEYSYNSQLDGPKRPNNYYFNGMIDLSGNILGLAQGANLDETKRIFGTRYAQYIKLQADFRYYRNLTDKTVLATRAMFGYGYAYGNSYGLPNIKRFFSGGSSSLRGFSSRLVGPGTYNEFYLFGTRNNFEVLGDIKAELNAEFRAKLYRFIEAGIFADAGNVWLLRDDPMFPGGKFTQNFYEQLAVDMGLGIRLDLSILLLRFDFAIPVRKPWLPSGQRWTFNDIGLGDPDWRKENLYFNLAIGYPF